MSQKGFRSMKAPMGAAKPRQGTKTGASIERMTRAQRLFKNIKFLGFLGYKNFQNLHLKNSAKDEGRRYANERDDATNEEYQCQQSTQLVSPPVFYEIMFRDESKFIE